MPTSLEYEYDRAWGIVAECVRRVASGELSVVIDKKLALSDAAKAHRYIEERKAFDRVVLVPAALRTG